PVHKKAFSSYDSRLCEVFVFEHNNALSITRLFRGIPFSPRHEATFSSKHCHSHQWNANAQNDIFTRQYESPSTFGSSFLPEFSRSLPNTIRQRLPPSPPPS